MSNFLGENEDQSTILPIIPLVIENNKEEKPIDKSKKITWELKTGSGRQLPSTYKKTIHRFEEGTEFEFIQLIYDVKEVFKQNSIAAGPQRDNIIKNLLLGESLEIYQSAMKDLRQPTGTGTALQAITNDMVKSAMQELGKSVFPFRALDKQKAYMQRNMK